MGIGSPQGIFAFSDLSDNLPPILRATVGCGDLYIHLDRCFEADENAPWRYFVECDVGGTDSNYYGRPRWKYAPQAGDAGDHDWTIHRYYDNTEILPAITKTLTVSAGTSTAARKLCVVGDSTGEERNINAVMRLDGSGMTVTTVGDVSDSGTDSEGGSQSFDHEGHSAWTLNSFIARTDSPFVSAPNVVDFPTWVTAKGFAAGDFMYWALGINDVVFLTTDADVDAAIASWHVDLEKLIGMSDSPPASSLRGAEPGAIVLIDLVIPPAPEEAWDATGQNQWFYRRSIHKLRRMLIDTYATAAYRAKNIHILGSNLMVPQLYGWETAMEAISDVADPQIERVDDRIHPDPVVYYKIGDHIATWVLALGG